MQSQKRTPVQIKTLRQLAYERDRGRCRYCGAIVPMDYHVDHVVPKSAGGKHALENLATACVTCNFRKGRKPAESVGMKLRPIPEHLPMPFMDEIPPNTPRKEQPESMPFNPAKVSEMRRKAGLTLSEAARLAGCPVQQLKDLEDGRYRDPRFRTIYRISVALNCKMEDFVTRNEV